MRNDRIIPGLILVLIGAMVLLHNFGYVNFHWHNFIALWPVFLLIGGVNLVFAHNRSPWATIIKITVVIACFALLAFGNFNGRYAWWPHYYYNYHHHNRNDNNDDSDDNDDDDDDNPPKKGDIVKVEGNSTFNAEYTPGARIARLNISGGGTTYNLNDTTNQLFKANTKEFYGKYQFDHQLQDSVYVLNFNMKNEKGHLDFGGDKSNSADFQLNVNPEWEINVETGASKLDFDLSRFKIRSLKLKGGAAAFDIKLGEPLATTNINVSTGASAVDVNIPKDAACRIEADYGLSSTSFDGFTKMEDGHYETPGFAAAKNKIYINMSGGVSDFNVHRY